jgi:hypothetical protein
MRRQKIKLGRDFSLLFDISCDPLMVVVYTKLSDIFLHAD